MRTDKPFKSFRARVDLKQFVEWWDTYNQERYGDFPVTVSTGLCDGIATSRPGESPMYYVLFDDYVRTRVPQSFVKPFEPDEDDTPDMVSYPFPVTVDLEGWRKWYSGETFDVFDTPIGFATEFFDASGGKPARFNIVFENLSSAFVPQQFVTIDNKPLPPIDFNKIAQKLESMVTHFYNNGDSMIYGIYETLYILNNAPLPDAPPGVIAITDIDTDRLIAALEGYRRQPATGGYVTGVDVGTSDPSPTVVKVDRVDSQPYTTPIRPGKWKVRDDKRNQGYYSIFADIPDGSELDSMVCDFLDAEDAQHIVELHNRNLGIGTTPPVFGANQTGKEREDN